MEKKTKLKYYDITAILEKKALYNVIFGERSNGKTYQVLKLILFGNDKLNIKGYLDGGGQGAYIRRLNEDLIELNKSNIWEPFIIDGSISKETKGKYNEVVYKSRRWYLAHRDQKGEIDLQDETPFCYAFALTKEQQYKSNSYLGITKIFFDEFLTRTGYLGNEFLLFTSILSTIIRTRDNLIIFMCGNTVNQYSPYFDEMGLYDIRNQKKNTIQVYTYGDTGLTVACEYADFPSKQKPSDKYFAFKNQQLKMITEGEWEIGVYPHCPTKILPRDILYKYYIIYHENTLQCEIILQEDCTYTFIHRKTTDIKFEEDTIVYSLVPNHSPHFRTSLYTAFTPLEQKIIEYFKKNKVFYDTNNTGEIVRNYLQDLERM